MNQEINKSAKLSCGATTEQCLKYYTDLQTNVTYENKNEKKNNGRMRTEDA
jgi:hypothetical protein